MSRRRRNRSDRDDEPVLFDLPLDPPEPPRREPEREAPGEAAEPEEEGTEPATAAAEPGVLSLFDERELPSTREPGPRPVAEPKVPPPAAEARPRPAPAPAADRPPADALSEEPFESLTEERRPERVTIASRYLAGLADFAVHAAVAVLLLLGARLLGVPAGFGAWPALVVFLLVFSFLYSILPFAFWGQTPGMAWAGLVARAPGDVSLTFGQAARRWAGALLTVALLGLPTLLAVAGGRSLADRLSGSDLSTA